MVGPGIYPSDTPRDAESHAERKLYEALKRGLPAGWFAWHSLSFSSGGWDREIDFVIAHPARGFLAIEVKGGQVELRDGHYFQNGSPMKDPAEQARGGAHALHRLLPEDVAHKVPFGFAVWLPDTAFTNAPTKGDLKGRVCGEQDLKWIPEALDSLFATLPFDASRAHPNRWLSAIHDLWGDRWIPKVKLGTRVKQAEAELIALDQAQRTVLDMIVGNPRLRIEGAAGTGKSMLAVEAARRRAGRGEKVLLTCFTRGLARWLREELAGLEGVDVSDVRQLAADVLRASGVPVDEEAPGFWKRASGSAVDVSLEDAGFHWDAVIVDEGQDLDEDDWIFVAHCANDGPLWVFYDPAQRFWADRSVPTELVPVSFRLPRIYRTPSALSALAASFAERPEGPHPVQEAIEGGSLVLVAAHDEASVTKSVERELTRLLAEQVDPSDIAIISLRGQSDASSIARLDTLGGRRLVRADAPDAREHVIADTFLRTKGLERAFVIITDLHQVKGEVGVRLYVALTRALVAARVVAPAGVLAKHGLGPRADAAAAVESP